VAFFARSNPDQTTRTTGSEMTAAGRVPRWLMEMAPEQYAVPVSSVIYQSGVRHPERCSAVHFASGLGAMPAG
jgi:hypothetical protein